MANVWRILVALAVTVVTGVLVIGCGTKFELPTETPGGFVPPDSSYIFKGGLGGVPNVTDILITRSSGNQLMIVHGALPDTRDPGCPDIVLPSGMVDLYPIFPPPGATPLSVRFDGMWRPQCVAEGGGILFAFDAGDTCATTATDSLPRIYGYQIGNPTPLFSFVDTTRLSDSAKPRIPVWVGVRGLAVSSDRTVYVSGTLRVREPDERGAFSIRFRDRIFRYKEISAGNYVWDDEWEVLPGTGVGFIGDPRGIAWGPSDDPYLWVTDGEKQAIQKLRIETDSESHGIYAFDGTASGGRFLDPTDVDVDENGFIYVVDRGSARTLRYDDLGFQAEFIQQINLGTVTGEPLLRVPNRAAVLDTIYYVSDPSYQAALRYERRRK
jgi:hypothetical protein